MTATVFENLVEDIVIGTNVIFNMGTIRHLCQEKVTASKGTVRFINRTNERCEECAASRNARACAAETINLPPLTNTSIKMKTNKELQQDTPLLLEPDKEKLKRLGLAHTLHRLCYDANEENAYYMPTSAQTERSLSTRAPA